MLTTMFFGVYKQSNLKNITQQISSEFDTNLMPGFFLAYDTLMLLLCILLDNNETPKRMIMALKID